MDKVLADLLTRQRAALKAEALALTATADKDTDGKLTAEQETRFKVIEGDITAIDAQLATSQQQPAAETPEQIADRVRAEVADITAACALAGKPARAAEFIKAKAKLSDVVATLQAERAKAEETTTTRHGHVPGSPPAGKSGPSASEIYSKRAEARAKRIPQRA
ncbi:hypothetical protein P9279_22065 [Mesorhizobium sp. WSM4962]|uniref:hypothetical protein n=1 Tax=Mesorhizobium sp. WSM4962 TaxID=3038548 RepID=UPI0024161566|nr:hypothetical protein [Mesorhizobium sp. WSM4962]MDG4903199.1 hypothetical protein [Mesorhizobium sp. WSM4962]